MRCKTLHLICQACQENSSSDTVGEINIRFLQMRIHETGDPSLSRDVATLGEWF